MDSNSMSSNSIYLCKLAKGDGWEEVTKEVFENRKFALSDDESAPRYNSDFAVINNVTKVINVNVTSGNTNSLGILMRFFKISPPVGSTPEGFVKTPTTILFKNNRTSYLLNLKTGNKYKKVS